MLDVIILPCWRVRYLVLKLPSSSIILKTLKDWEKLVSYTENRTCTHLMNLLRCRAILNLCNEPSERAYRRCWVEFGGGGVSSGCGFSYVGTSVLFSWLRQSSSFFSSTLMVSRDGISRLRTMTRISTHHRWIQKKDTDQNFTSLQLFIFKIINASSFKGILHNLAVFSKLRKSLLWSLLSTFPTTIPVNLCSICQIQLYTSQSVKFDHFHAVLQSLIET